MKKRILFAVLGVIVIIAILAGIKTLQIRAMIDNGKKFVPPAETITTAVVKSDTWDTSLGSFGTLTAVQGVSVSAEAAGKVMKIAFEPGTAVRKGDLLIQQDISTEEAQLPGALSQVALSRANQKRADQLYTEGIISQADHDQAISNSAQSQSQVDTIRSSIARKTIRAPFSGRVGLRQVNLGQMLREGDLIVTLQALDPIFVDFSIPQQQLSQVRVGQPVRLTGDVLGSEAMTGKITAITPLVDADTRNVRIQATVANKGERLRPGMFVNASVGLPQKQNVLAIPATAVLYAPYSDSVFVVEKKKDDKSGKEGLALRQQFVRLGEKRGDFVAVTSGLKDNETVVSTGAFKLRNGQSVVVDNKLSPQFQQNPKPENN
ncbi:MAG: efflux RND transporter periplasmic adaptor subunit [Desulfuromonadales bacterium]|nr:efflux RND transporter periplasmic adaptor subunit [Desulfuromonadales bacterium]